MTGNQILNGVRRYFYTIDTHFLLLITTVYIAAIGVSGYTTNHTKLIFFTIASLVCAIQCKNRLLKKFFLLCIVFSTGTYHFHTILSYHESLLTLSSESRIEIQGTIKDIQAIPNSRCNSKVLLKTDSIAVNNNPKKQCDHLIQIYTNSADQLQIDDYVLVKNISIPRNTNSWYTFYLYKEGISASVFAKKLNYTLLKRPDYSILRSITTFRANIFEKIANKTRNFAIISTLFWGNRRYEEKNTKDTFKQWGISHYLARSGLHLIIFVMIWQLVLSMIPLPFYIKQFLLLLCVILYSLFSWPSISFTRAVYMFLLYKLAIFWDKPTHYLHLVTVITALILLINPFYVFFLDFQLSFGLTFCLAWFNQVVYAKDFNS